ncbi:MAG: hypothetical protein ACK2UO_03495 [Caldilineaceae bacterium]|jgi:5'-methylthioadenosine phosphorylase
MSAETSRIGASVSDRADLLLLLSVTLPPIALNVFGPLVDEVTIETTYGTVGPIGLREREDGRAVWVEPYSGGPRRTDPRATIIAAAQLGSRQILAWDTAIALDSELQRGQVAIVGDYIDWTCRSRSTFSRSDTPSEQIAFVSRRPAFCTRMTDALRQALPDAADVVYLAVDGPRRETAAEARMMRAWGADVTGLNLVPEVSLAQEAGICFGGMVTIADLAADQAQPQAHGEVRASLGAALSVLPALIDELSLPGECLCATTVG